MGEGRVPSPTVHHGSSALPLPLPPSPSPPPPLPPGEDSPCPAATEPESHESTRPPLLTRSAVSGRYTAATAITSPSSFSAGLAIYGLQLTIPASPLADILVGCLATADLLRRRQINVVVTSGCTPGDRHNGYVMAAAWAERDATLTQETLRAQPWQRGPLDRVLTTKAQPVREAIRQSARLAVQVRAGQLFRDGNHRTGLLVFVLALAESGVLLTSSFDVYRAYIIISAREHASNTENTLDAAGIADTSEKLFNYSRTRTRYGNADWPYVVKWAAAIRELPLRASVIVEYFDSIRAWHSTGEQVHAWRSLESSLKRDLRYAYPAYHGPWNGFTPR